MGNENAFDSFKQRTFRSEPNVPGSFHCRSIVIIRIIKLSIKSSDRLDTEVQSCSQTFSYFRCLRSNETSKVEKCDLKTELPSDFNGSLLRVRTPTFPSLVQEKVVQTGYAWVETIGGDAISVACCLPPCPGLCTHSEDRRLCSSFPPLHILQGSQWETPLSLPETSLTHMVSKRLNKRHSPGTGIRLQNVHCHQKKMFTNSLANVTCQH